MDSTSMQGGVSTTTSIVFMQKWIVMQANCEVLDRVDDSWM